MVKFLSKNFFRASFRLPAVIVSLFLAWTTLHAAETTTPRTSAKLLTVGNSFADNITMYITDFAKAGNKQLVLFKANLGGHSLDQHVKYLKAFEANPDDPVGHAYKGRVDPKTGQKKDFSLKEALISEQWDYVTIQQVSHKSYLSETYQPHADILIDYIKKNAPQAEILVHETWSYRQDNSFFKNNNLTPKTMYEGLKAAYEKLADANGFRMIPSGDAFQAARATSRWGEGTNQLLAKDAKHADNEGCFLGGAVLYEVIYGENVELNTFVPSGMSEEDAKALRHIAHETVLARQQKKGTESKN